MRRLRSDPALQLQLPAVLRPNHKIKRLFPLLKCGRYKQSMLVFGGVADDDALETSTFFNDVCVPAPWHTAFLLQ